MVSPRPRIRLVTAHMASSSRALLPASQQVVGERGDHAGQREGADQQAAAGEDADQLDEGAAVDLEEAVPAPALPPSSLAARNICRRARQQDGVHPGVELAGEAPPCRWPRRSRERDAARLRC